VNRAVHVCSFSALDDLPKKLHGNDAAVLDALRRAGRFSAFEVTPELGRTLDRLRAIGRIVYGKGGAYPWATVTVLEPKGASK